MFSLRRSQALRLCHELFALSYPLSFPLYGRTGKGTLVAPGVRVYQPRKLWVGAGGTIAAGTQFRITGGSRVRIGDRVAIGSHVVVMTYAGDITIGDDVSINPFCVLYGIGPLTIGNNVMIATGCVLVPANHITTRTDVPMRQQGITKQGIVIEDDVWLGAGVKVTDGVRIGTGAVIGAGAVVTRDIPPYSIAVGVPARVVRDRREELSATISRQPSAVSRR